MLPFATTKVGSGEKTKAYVIRQNVCLKIALLLLVGAVSMTMILSMTLYDVHIERRYRARSAGVHRREEHNLRMQIGRLGMRLQRHMEDDVGDMSKVRVFRANMFRLVGEFGLSVRRAVADRFGSNATDAVGLPKLEVDFTSGLDDAMSRLWKDLNRDGKRARATLQNITREILVDLELDEAERKQFEEEYGVDSEYYLDAQKGFLSGSFDEDLGEEEFDGMGEDMEEHRMRAALERMLVHINELPNITAPADELHEWESMLDKAYETMGDVDKEADLKAIGERITAKLRDRGIELSQLKRAGASDEGGSGDAPIDALQVAIEAAKLGPRRDDLLDHFSRWKAGRMPTYDLVEYVEELYDEHALETGLFDEWDD